MLARLELSHRISARESCLLNPFTSSPSKAHFINKKTMMQRATEIFTTNCMTQEQLDKLDRKF